MIDAVKACSMAKEAKKRIAIEREEELRLNMEKAQRNTIVFCDTVLSDKLERDASLGYFPPSCKLNLLSEESDTTNIELTFAIADAGTTHYEDKRKREYRFISLQIHFPTLRDYLTINGYQLERATPSKRDRFYKYGCGEVCSSTFIVTALPNSI